MPARELQESCNVVKQSRPSDSIPVAASCRRHRACAIVRPTHRPRTPTAPDGRRSRLGFLTVGQTARILGVSASTLRLWESVGLVAPVRSNGRYRLYSPELLKVSKRIKYLREVQRLNVPGIKRELGGPAAAPKRAASRSRSAPSSAACASAHGTGRRGGRAARRNLRRVSQLDRARTGQRVGRHRCSGWRPLTARP